MFALLVLGSLLALIVCAVMCLVNLIRKKKNNKPLIGLGVAFAVLVVSFIATPTSSSSSSSNYSSASSKTESKAVSSISSAETKQSDEVSISEQVLVEQEGIKITAKSYTPDAADTSGIVWLANGVIPGADGLNLLIENDSGKNIEVYCDGLAVNDFMIDTTFMPDVSTGKKQMKRSIFRILALLTLESMSRRKLKCGLPFTTRALKRFCLVQMM